MAVVHLHQNIASGSSGFLQKLVASSFIILRMCFAAVRNKKRGPAWVVQISPALLWRSASCDLSAELGDVLCRRALLTLHDVEFDALAFSQRLEAGRLGWRVMNEAEILLLPFSGW